MKAEALTALADRVEREEPSRYLDADIEEAERGYATAEPLYYTTSIDAAVMLVPEKNEWWEVYVEKDWVYVEKDWKHHARAQIDIAVQIITAFGLTPAAALTAAALRARAALLTDGANPVPPKVRTP